MQPLFFSSLQSDSEYMSGQLSAFGYAITEEPEGADLWLINTYGYSVLLGYFFILSATTSSLAVDKSSHDLLQHGYQFQTCLALD